MKTMKFERYDGTPVTLKVELGLYHVDDVMSAIMREVGMPVSKEAQLYGVGLQMREADTGEPFDVATVSFGEFIGMKNAAYMDTNNAPNLARGLLAAGVAEDTGFTHRSGFCTYPLFVFDEAFLRECGEEEYERYSQAHDRYMASLGEEREEEAPTDDER